MSQDPDPERAAVEGRHCLVAIDPRDGMVVEIMAGILTDANAREVAAWLERGLVVRSSTVGHAREVLFETWREPGA